MRPRIGCYAVYEPTEEGWEDHQAQFETICAALEKAGAEVIPAAEAVMDEASCSRVAEFFSTQKIDLLHALIITWSFDHYTYLIQQKVGLPVVIRTIPGIRTGSVVGGQQLGCLLSDLDIQHKLVYGALDGGRAVSETMVYAKACGLRNQLKGAAFLMLGRRTPGMTPIAVDEVELMRTFGIRMITMGMDEFQHEVDAIPRETAAAHWKDLIPKAASVTSTSEHGIATMQYYLALKKLIGELNLKAVTVGSYPACAGTACLPISLLNDEKAVVAGCEGDMNSTLAMFLLNQLSEGPVLFGEMLEINEEENTLVTSHCGAGSASMADQDGFILCPVRLMHTGVAIRFKSKPGSITYVNLSGRKDNYRLCSIEGDGLPTEMVFEGNPLRFRLKSPISKVWNAVDEYGFNHHWMCAYGNHTAVLTEFCKLTGIRGVFPDIDRII